MVDHCWIYGFAQNGIDVAVGGVSNLKVINTVIENVTLDGMHLNSTGGQVNVMINNTEIMNCAGDGIEAAAKILDPTARNRTVGSLFSGMPHRG